MTRQQQTVNLCREKLDFYRKIVINATESLRTPEADYKQIRDDALSEAVGQFEDDTIYSVHECGQQIIKYRHCGPVGKKYLREGAPDMRLEQGCIGKAITSNLLIRNISDLKKVEGEYVKGSSRSKSELIICPALRKKSRIFPILNIESPKRDAFEAEDEIGFLSLGLLFAAFETERLSRARLINMARRIAKVLNQTERTPGHSPEGGPPEPLDDNIKDVLNSLVNADAGTISSLVPKDMYRDINLNFYWGSGFTRNWLENFQTDRESIAAEVLKSGSSILVTNDTPRLQKKLREYREISRIGLGVPIEPPLHESGRSALVLAEDTPHPDHLHDLEAAQAASSLIGEILNIDRSLEHRKKLDRIVAAMPEITKLASRSASFYPLLSKAAEIARASIHATGCCFLEVRSGDASERSLEAVAFQVAASELAEKDLTWQKLMNDRRAEILDRLESDESFDFPYPDLDSQDGDTPSTKCYRVFCRELRVIGKHFIFLSFKRVASERQHALRMSNESNQLLSTFLSVLKRQIEATREAAEGAGVQEGMRCSLRALLIPTSDSLRRGAPRGTFWDAETIQKVHAFVSSWGLTSTNLTGVFYFDEKKEALSLDDISYGILTKDQKNPPKNLDIPLKEKGLTANVFTQNKSKLSTQVSQEGSSRCRKFWDRLSSAQSHQRFFAGVPIVDPKKKIPMGVLTVNGFPRPPVSVEPLDWSWRILPTLKILGEVLGEALHISDEG